MTCKAEVAGGNEPRGARAFTLVPERRTQRQSERQAAQGHLIGRATHDGIQEVTEGPPDLGVIHVHIGLRAGIDPLDFAGVRFNSLLNRETVDFCEQDEVVGPERLDQLGEHPSEVAVKVKR